ncbi:hypothetical protein JTE90_022098 [Oedothorax gibbosus]|uniref:Uncharacterized protein n=1 Tax=Oedothorax gibbosus TaxID=931172 RepID=A0AAV6TEB1_9ARAC|nr:hypothetical protein JTE90_022098 [Oedothorax gibbosus]
MVGYAPTMARNRVTGNQGSFPERDLRKGPTTPKGKGAGAKFPTPERGVVREKNDPRGLFLSPRNWKRNTQTPFKAIINLGGQAGASSRGKTCFQ